MNTAIEGFVSGFPEFIVMTLVAGGMLVLGTMIYVLLTPWKELALVRGGNGAAGLALAGAITGLAMPLAACLASSAEIFDLIIWGVAALLMQLIAYRVVDMLLSGIPARIEKDEAGAAIVLIAAKLAAAMLLSAGLWDPNFGRF